MKANGRKYECMDVIKYREKWESVMGKKGSKIEINLYEQYQWRLQ
jgi:hypothetical protein